MNQELEDRANSFRNMIVDFNRGAITTKDAIKKELLALNKLNNSDYHLYFYAYKTQDNKIVDRVCGLDLHSELFLKGLEQLSIELNNYKIRYTENGPILDLNNQLFLDTNMDAGHGGASGRFEALKELAKEFAFLLDLEKIKK